MLVLKSADAVATIDPYGGQVMSCRIAGGEDLLWRTSDEHLAAAQAGGKAMRGGVPVCWPWFGPHATPGGPVHVLARVAVWSVREVAGDRATLTFATDGANPLFPHAAEGVLEVRVGRALAVTLTTTNRGSEPFRLTQCFHTYLRVGDVGRVEVRGLEGTTSNRGEPAPEPFTISGEVDRIYAPVSGPLQVVDPVLGRTIHIHNGGCSEAVVWNPGSDKADMPAGSFRQMLCVEPANVADAPVLAPGQSAVLSTEIRAVPL